MAENGNERYLRYILLLGEGVLLVLRGVVRREVQRTGLTLDAILTIPNNRRQIERNCHSETQRLHLFPSPTSVNSDIETWDTSLLTLVIERMFWSNLTRDERLRISYLRDSRNVYQGHPPAMSMEETEYRTRSIDLTTTLQDLATGLDQQTSDTLVRIINDSNAVQFDFHTAIQNLQQLYEFKEDMLRELENKFQDVKTQLDTIQAIVKKIQELQIRQWKRNTENELKTIIEAKCDHKEKEKKALDVLFDFVKMIQNQKDFNEEEIKHNIEQRIRWHGDICLQLIDDLLLWFSDMYNIPNAIPGAAQQGSIRIPIKCSSMEGLLKQMEYMDSANSKERLSEISYSLSKIIDSTCSLSWTIVPASLQKVMVTLSKDLETSHLSVESGKIVLPFQSKSLNGLSNIWSMFEGEEVNDHLARASKTLSKIVGADITLTTSVVKDQFTNAVYKMNKDDASHSFDTTKNPLEYLQDDDKTKERETESVYGVDSQSFETLKKPFEYLQGDEKTIYDDESKPFKMRTDNVFGLSDDVETKKREKEFKSEQDLVIDIHRDEKTKKGEKSSVADPGSRSFGTTKNPLEYLQGDEKTKQGKQKSIYGRIYDRVVNVLSVPMEPKEREKSSVYDPGSRSFGTTKNPLEYLQDDEKTKQGKQKSIYGRIYDDDSQLFEILEEPFQYLQSDEKTIYDDESKPFKMRTHKVFDLSDDVETKKKEEEFKSDRFPKRMSGEGSALRTESSTGSEKDYERHLKFKHAGKYLVRFEKDSNTPSIVQIEVLPNGRILLLDWMNDRLKMLDSSFNVVSYCDLPDWSHCVSYIGNDTAVVGLKKKDAVLVRVSGGIVIERFLELDFVSCVHSLAFYGETLYIYDVDGTVYTSTTDGHLQGVLYKTRSRVNFPWGKCIAISDDGEMIYLKTIDQGLVTINNKGTHLSTLRPDSSRGLSSICTVGDGTIFVLDVDSQNVFQVDYGGTKVLNVVKLLPGGKYYAMCYDRKHSRLIVAGAKRDIHVFEHQK